MKVVQLLASEEKLIAFIAQNSLPLSHKSLQKLTTFFGEELKIHYY